MTTGSDRVGSGIRLALLNASYQSLANAYYLLIRSVYVVVFARLLGVESYGHFVYSQGWYVLAMTVAAWGMAELAIAESARLEPKRRDLLLARGFALRLLLGATGCALVVAAAYLLESDPELRLLIVIYSQAVLARGASNWIMTLFVARESTRNWLMLSVPFLTLEVAVAILLAWAGAGLPAIALAQCATWWLLFFTGWFVYRRQFGPILPRLGRRFTGFFLANGASLALAAFTLSCMGTGLLIVYRYFSENAQQLGEAAFVIQVVIILGQLIKVISNSALPQLNLPVASRDRRQSFYVATVWTQSLYLGAALHMLCQALLPPLVVALVGDQFAGAAALFARCSWLLIPMLLIYGLRLVLISNRRTNALLLAMLAGPLLLLLQLGLMAAADALTLDRLMSALGLAYSGIAGLVLALVLRLTRPVGRSWLLVAPLVLLLALPLYYQLLEHSPWLALAVGLLPLLFASTMSLRSSYRQVTAASPGDGVTVVSPAGD